MHKIDLQFTVHQPFGNLHRKKVVLIAAEDQDGNILVGTKPLFYPPAITRLLGGGVDQEEDEPVAAVRELSEELGVNVEVDDLTALSVITATVEDEDGNNYYHETYVYHVFIGDTQYKAGDDVKAIIKLSVDELYELGERFEALPEVLWYKGPEGIYSWIDYAKLYGPVHKLTAEHIKEIRSVS